jgi:hypothetical protein
LQTSQGYIICILQHFATKLWNITNFVMLFQAVMKFLSRLVEFKILVNWEWSIEMGLNVVAVVVGPLAGIKPAAALRFRCSATILG